MLLVKLIRSLFRYELDKTPLHTYGIRHYGDPSHKTIITHYVRTQG
jgi:hypothetical protein